MTTMPTMRRITKIKILFFISLVSSVASRSDDGLEVSTDGKPLFMNIARGDSNYLAFLSETPGSFHVSIDAYYKKYRGTATIKQGSGYVHYNLNCTWNFIKITETNFDALYKQMTLANFRGQPGYKLEWQKVTVANNQKIFWKVCDRITKCGLPIPESKCSESRLSLNQKTRTLVPIIPEITTARVHANTKLSLKPTPRGSRVDWTRTVLLAALNLVLFVIVLILVIYIIIERRKHPKEIEPEFSEKGIPEEVDEPTSLHQLSRHPSENESLNSLYGVVH